MANAKVEMLDRELVERLARIIGPHAGAAKALAEADAFLGGAPGRTVTFGLCKAAGYLLLFKHEAEAAAEVPA